MERTDRVNWTQSPQPGIPQDARSSGHLTSQDGIAPAVVTSEGGGGDAADLEGWVDVLAGSIGAFKLPGGKKSALRQMCPPGCIPRTRHAVWDEVTILRDEVILRNEETCGAMD